MVVDTVALEKGLRVEYNKAQEAMLKEAGAAKAVAALATIVPSGAASEKYGWLGDVPLVKEWLGPKTAGGLKDYDYSIKNKDFYTAIEIDRNEIEDDQIKIIVPRIGMLVLAVANYKFELIEDLIINGVTGLSYDGSAFFADRAAPNDNLLAGTGTTVAQIKADIYSARAAMMQFQSDVGRVLGFAMDTIVVPPALEGAMLEAVMSTTAPDASASGVFNPIKGWIKQVIVMPRLSDADDWYGFCTNFPLRPFVFQNRKDPTPVLDDSEVKKTRKYIYSAEMRGNAGYGFFQMGVKVVN
jgi:phage major head subunit gpT-like protein